MGAQEIAAALDSGAPLRLLLAAEAPRSSEARAVIARVREAGIPVLDSSANALRRLGKCEPPAELLALLGPPPDAGREAVLAAGGVAWLLVGIAYPGNTGFAIRTAEVSGADGIFIDSAFDHSGRREAVRAAMRADRFMPVFWEPALPVLEAARTAGRRIYAVEDVGSHAPWELDLRGPLLLVVGGERHGIPQEVLSACDGAIRIPMRGFIPSYNLQAAMAGVAVERLRQQEQDADPTR